MWNVCPTTELWFIHIINWVHRLSTEERAIVLSLEVIFPNVESAEGWFLRWLGFLVSSSQITSLVIPVSQWQWVMILQGSWHNLIMQTWGCRRMLLYEQYLAPPTSELWKLGRLKSHTALALCCLSLTQAKQQNVCGPRAGPVRSSLWGQQREDYKKACQNWNGSIDM